MREIDNTQDVLDSRDIIERIEELVSELMDVYADRKENADYDDFPEFDEWLGAVADSDIYGADPNYCDEAHELVTLKAVAEEGENSPDWLYGETLIRDSYFTDYIEALINDCYELPKEFNSGDWPWRHMQIDFEAAADEAKQDYFEVDFDGVTYWIRE